MKALAWIVIIILLAPLVYFGPGIISGMTNNDSSIVGNVAAYFILWMIYIMPAVALAAMVLSEKKERSHASQN